MNMNKLPIHDVDVEHIKITTGNRDKIDPVKLRELADSIRIHGILQPVILQAGKEADVYHLVAGERRVRAAILLGMETIPARVMPENINEEERNSIRLVENLQREDLTPWEEAAQLGDLHAKTKYAVETLADMVGKSNTWVAQRLAIGRLILPLQELVIAQNWPLSHLPVLARVPVDCQAEVLEMIKDCQKRQHGWTEYRDGKSHPVSPALPVLQSMLDDFQQLLSTARWKLDDAKLLPDAGACKNCPKRLSAQAVLFPEVKDFAKRDRCLDAGCWQKKEAAFVALQVDKLKAKKPLLLKSYVEVQPLVQGALGNDAHVINTYDVIDCKQKDKGARPAVLVSGPELGKTVWVKEKPKQGGTMPGRKQVDQETGKAKPRSTTERLQVLAHKRMCRAVEMWMDCLEDFVPEAIYPLVAVFGTWHRKGHRDPKDWEVFASVKDQSVQRNIWDEMIELFKERLKRYGPMESQAEGLWAEMLSQAAAMDQTATVSACWRKAIEENQLPKSLAKEGVTDPHADGALPDQEVEKPKKKAKGAA